MKEYWISNMLIHGFRRLKIDQVYRSHETPWTPKHPVYSRSFHSSCSYYEALGTSFLIGQPFHFRCGGCKSLIGQFTIACIVMSYKLTHKLIVAGTLCYRSPCFFAGFFAIFFASWLFFPLVDSCRVDSGVVVVSWSRFESVLFAYIVFEVWELIVHWWRLSCSRVWELIVCLVESGSRRVGRNVAKGSAQTAVPHSAIVGNRRFAPPIADIILVGRLQLKCQSSYAQNLCTFMLDCFLFKQVLRMIAVLCTRTAVNAFVSTRHAKMLVPFTFPVDGPRNSLVNI